MRFVMHIRVIRGICGSTPAIRSMGHLRSIFDSRALQQAQLRVHRQRKLFLAAFLTVSGFQTGPGQSGLSHCEANRTTLRCCCQLDQFVH